MPSEHRTGAAIGVRHSVSTDHFSRRLLPRDTLDPLLALFVGLGGQHGKARCNALGICEYPSCTSLTPHQASAFVHLYP
jgi:hypothetical protein